MFRLVKIHVAILCLVLDTYRKHRITLNLKKCIFCIPYKIFLDHVFCKQGLKVYIAKIVVIINLEAPKNVKQLDATLGHMRYYRKFIKAYVQITVPMERLLKKDATFCGDEDC